MARSYHHGALAEAMVEQALGEVREHGAEQLSLRAVAQALDVSPSAAYNHFADKEALLGAVGACGIAALDERMSRALAAHPGNTPDAAKARFAGLGRSYLSFAIEDPHLFRLTFSPTCHWNIDDQESMGAPYDKLNRALDELDALGLLKPGSRQGLEIIVWSATHGMACLLVDGLLPAEMADSFVDTMNRLVLV